MDSTQKLIGKSDYDFFPKEQADLFTRKDREMLAGRIPRPRTDAVDHRTNMIVAGELGVHLIRPANPRSISSRLHEGGLCVLPLHGAIVMPVLLEIVLVEYKFGGKPSILWLHRSRLTESAP